MKVAVALIAVLLTVGLGTAGAARKGTNGKPGSGCAGGAGRLVTCSVYYGNGDTILLAVGHQSPHGYWICVAGGRSDRTGGPARKCLTYRLP